MTDDLFKVDAEVDAEVKMTAEPTPEPEPVKEPEPVEEPEPKKMAEPTATKAVATKKKATTGATLLVTTVAEKGGVIADVVKSYCTGRGDVTVTRKGDKLTVTGDIPEGLEALLDRYEYVLKLE